MISRCVSFLLPSMFCSSYEQPLLIYHRNTSFQYNYNNGDFDQHRRGQASGNPIGSIRSKIYQQHKGLGESRSESHLHYQSLSPILRNSPMRGEHLDYRSDGEHAGEELHFGQILSSNRSCFGSRTPSPRRLNDIKEEQCTKPFLESSAAFPSSPIKRSRSPAKQLFGEQGWLGRSTSMRELPSEEYRKTGIKYWGGKLKQRIEDIVSPLI